MALVVGVFVIGLVASWYVAGRLVAPARRSVGDLPADLPGDVISLVSHSGSRICGWHIPVTRSRAVVVLLHGMHLSRLVMLDRARMLYAAGYSVVMIDLQAHGGSSGTHITVGHLEKHDVKAAVEFAREQHPKEAVGVIGISLGGASALLASPLDVDALILESVYPNIAAAIHNRVAAQLGFLAAIPAEILLQQLKWRLGISRSDLRPIDFVSKVRCPLFILSGAVDRHTTATETQELFEAALSPKELWLVDGAAHVDLLTASPADYKDKVLGFLERHLATPTPQ